MNRREKLFQEGRLMNRCYAFLRLFGLMAIAGASQAFGAISIATVPVGNPGNAADMRYADFLSPNGFGSVDYDFRIGKFEVTNAQYVEFLNGVDPTGANTLALYSVPFLPSDPRVSLLRDLGAANGSKYSVKPGRENNPAQVPYFRAIRFANWLHNGQGGGDTENGAYTLLGGTPQPSNYTTVTRNPGARWWLPSEDEWYKAAYHKNGGVSGNYWDYPTSTNVRPYSDQPPGTDAPDPSNTANFFKNDNIANGYDDGYATGSASGVQNYLTDVGAYTLSASPYGTFDQGGNVWELFESNELFSDLVFIRGDSFYPVFPDGADRLHASLRGNDWITSEHGFRMATGVPEPTALGLLLPLAVAALVRQRRERRRDVNL